METERERVRKEGLRLLSQSLSLLTKGKEDCHFRVAVFCCSLAFLSGTSNNPLDEPGKQLDPNNEGKSYRFRFELVL